MFHDSLLRFFCGAALPAVLGAGAATAAELPVKVDAMCHFRADLPVASYVIHGARPALDETSLRFKEVARQIKTALSGFGLYEAPNDESADVVVAIDYGSVRCPTRYVHVSMPIYAPPRSLASRMPPPGSAAILPPPPVDDDRTVIGYREVAYPLLTFEKYLTVIARDNRAGPDGRRPALVWRILASIEDTSKDIRDNLPVLASAFMNALGHDTEGPVTIKIDDHGPTIAFIKKGP